MCRRIVSILGVSSSLFLALMLGAALNISLVSGSGTIYIRVEGNVDPSDAPILNVGNVSYTLTANINDSIVVERNNIVLDGAGYTVQGTGSGTGITLSGRSNVTIKNMEIKEFDYGIHLSDFSNNTKISGNNITANEYHGIKVYESSNNSIYGNKIVANNDYGIWLFKSLNNSVFGNNITSNYAGTGLYGSSNNNSIFGNNITNNSQYDLVLSMSSNNSIFGNNITNSQYGIRLFESSNNSIYHNNFINNTNQVYTSNSVNVWDDGYPSGGNYWSDYTGIDLYSGPYQNETGSDGIGDTPYIIDTDNRDRYPLILTSEDITPPSTSHNYDGLWHTEDFIINLTATDNLSGVAETYYKINDGGASRKVSIHGQPLITTESANNTLEYWSVDNAGNEERPHKILTNIKLDKTPPTGYILINNNDPYTTTLNVTLTLNASDATSGVSQMRLSNDGTNWTAWETYTPSKAWNLSLGEGTKTVYAQYKDITGLVSPVYNDTIIVRTDVDPPITTISLSGVEGNNGWFTSNVTVTLSATDDNSGVEKTEYSFNNITWTIYTTPFNITNEGNTIIYYKSTDNAGNNETIKTETIKIDKTVPSGSIIINNGDAYTTSTSATLTLTATDDTSGLHQVRYSNDGTWDTEPWEISSPTKTWTLTPGDGMKRVYFQIKDEAGLVSETYSDTIILDTAPPTGSITINDGAAYTTTTTVTLTLSATDATSGIVEMRFSNDNKTYTEWQTYTTSTPWTLQNGDDDTKTVHVQFKDHAGLISTYSDTIILDIIPPTGSIIIAEGATYTNSTLVTLTLSADDMTSGVAQMRFSHDNITWMSWEDYVVSKAWDLPTSDGDKNVYVQFKDNAGLISQSYADTIILDTTPPSGSISIAEGSAYTNTTLVTLTLTATDATSGVAEMRFSNDNATWSDWEAYATSKSWILLTGDGIRAVTVQYRDNAGLISFYSDVIILDTTKPTANAGTDQTVAEDTLVTFDGSASTDENGIASYTWTFTDATPQTLSGKNPTYTFAAIGRYTVTLKVTDPAGNSATDTVIITVLDITQPIANAGTDQTVDEDTVVTFDASASSDNVGIISYTWTFTDAGTLQTLDGMNPTYTFQTPGIYTVTLNVTDDEGNYATDTVRITVLDITKPVANAGADRTVNEDTSITLDGSASTDNVGITAYTWTFTDLTSKTLTGEKPAYTFNIPSVYTITLNVTDADGNWATDIVVVTVLDITPPIANAGADQTVNEDTPVTFDALGSSDNVDIVGYTWTFTDIGVLRTLSGVNPLYTFDMPGTYTIILNVTDDAGNWAIDTVSITVLDVTNPIANAGQNQTVYVGETVTFDAGASSDNVGIISYEWNFGDETTGTGVTTTHTYAEPGTYTVTLTVKDAANNIHTNSITITVLPTEFFNLWIVGAIAAVLVGVALVITIVLAKKTKNASLP